MMRNVLQWILFLGRWFYYEGWASFASLLKTFCFIAVTFIIGPVFQGLYCIPYTGFELDFFVDYVGRSALNTILDEEFVQHELDTYSLSQGYTWANDFFYVERDFSFRREVARKVLLCTRDFHAVDGSNATSHVIPGLDETLSDPYSFHLFITIGLVVLMIYILYHIIYDSS